MTTARLVAYRSHKSARGSCVGLGAGLAVLVPAEEGKMTAGEFLLVNLPRNPWWPGPLRHRLLPRISSFLAVESEGWQEGQRWRTTSGRAEGCVGSGVAD
jgi:hypothetical protein